MAHRFCLEKPKMEDEREFVEMMRLWRLTKTNINPKLLRFFQGNYIRWLDTVERHRSGVIRGNELPQSLYFLKCDDILTGAVSIREKLRPNEIRGHISCGIHPSFRELGYGKIALRLSLKKIKEEYHLNYVQVICNADNVISKKLIEKTGGVFLRNTYKNDRLVNVYFFDMDKNFRS